MTDAGKLNEKGFSCNAYRNAALMEQKKEATIEVVQNRKHPFGDSDHGVMTIFGPMCTNPFKD